MKEEMRAIQWIELKLENVKHISTGGNNLT
jgi:hypothetical protein